MASRKQMELVSQFTRAEDSDKIGIVTGANSGIGYEASKMLAARGMRVILACRNMEKGEEARKKIISSVPGARLDLEQLDLASQKSVRSFTSRIKEKYKKLDLLVNNGGIMTGPHRLTGDGFEMIFATNHLGHFTLTAGLIKLLLLTPGSRIVTVSSIAHFKGIICFDDINSKSLYIRKEAYRQSKLANLLFAYELDRRLKEKGSSTLSIAVHPGISSTKIVKLPNIIDKLKDLVLMNPVKGAMPTMMGATDKTLKGGEFIGPEGRGQIFGFPAIVKSGRHSYDKETWLKLWELSEALTGTRFEI